MLWGLRNDALLLVFFGIDPNTQVLLPTLKPWIQPMFGDTADLGEVLRTVLFYRWLNILRPTAFLLNGGVVEL